MTSVQQQVTEFHCAFSVAIAQRATPDLRALRATLIREETGEVIDAVMNGSLPEIVQELADLVYVAYGTAISLGIDLDAAVTEVHRANMSKLGADGRLVLRGDGKVLKGPNYRAPNTATTTYGGETGDDETLAHHLSTLGSSGYIKVGLDKHVRALTGVEYQRAVELCQAVVDAAHSDDGGPAGAGSSIGQLRNLFQARAGGVT